MGEVTVYSSSRGLCSPAEVAGTAAACGAAWIMGAARACMAIRGWRLMRTDSSPSEISSSEIPDSSSSSINFFTLRISIPEPLEESSVLSVGQAGACGLERQLVADGTQSDNAADRDVGQIGMLSK